MIGDDSALGLPAHDDHEALANLIEGLKVAESAARQMAFYTSNAEWLKVHLALATTRDLSVKMAQARFAKRLIV